MGVYSKTAETGKSLSFLERSLDESAFHVEDSDFGFRRALPGRPALKSLGNEGLPSVSKSPAGHRGGVEVG